MPFDYPEPPAPGKHKAKQGAEIYAHFARFNRNGIIQICDFKGRFIQKIVAGNCAVDIGQYLSTPGVYCYTLQDAATGGRYTGRFIFR